MEKKQKSKFTQVYFCGSPRGLEYFHFHNHDALLHVNIRLLKFTSYSAVCNKSNTLPDFPVRPDMSVCGKDEEGRAASPVSSCLSLKSDKSKEIPLLFSNEHGRLHTQ